MASLIGGITRGRRPTLVQWPIPETPCLVSAHRLVGSIVPVSCNVLVYTLRAWGCSKRDRISSHVEINTSSIFGVTHSERTHERVDTHVPALRAPTGRRFDGPRSELAQPHDHRLGRSSGSNIWDARHLSSTGRGRVFRCRDDDGGRTLEPPATSSLLRSSLGDAR